MNRILFPTDFSDNSRAALPVAMRLAKTLHTPLDLSHTYPLPSRSEALTDNLLSVIRERCESDMSDWIKSVQGDPEVVCEGFCEFNGLAQELHQRASVHPDSLIVLASQGASGWSEVLLGSNAVSILHSTKLPVLIVPSKTAWGANASPNTWLYASDLNDERNPKALAWMKSFIAQIGAKLVVSHVQDGSQGDAPAQDFLHFAETYFPDSEHHLSVARTVETGIYDAVRKVNANGIILVSRRHHWLRDAFKPRTSTNVAYHTTYPVLILRED